MDATIVLTSRSDLRAAPHAGPLDGDLQPKLLLAISGKMAGLLPGARSPRRPVDKLQ